MIALTNSEAHFKIGVRFACFPPDALHVCYVILNSNFASLPVTGRKGKASLAVPLKVARLTSEPPDVLTALLRAISPQ